MWPFSHLKPKVPDGVSVEEAIATGIIAPVGYQPPARAGLRDTLRTMRVMGGLLARHVPRLLLRGEAALPSSQDADGQDAIRAFAISTLMAFGVEVEIEGAEHVPADGGLVFMWKQESHLDHLLLPAVLPRPCRTIYNTAVKETPVYGDYLAREGNYWVDKTDESQWRPAMARAARDVKDGICMLVSPEGTRTWDGGLLEMKRGAFILAEASERPIVCVNLNGAHDRLPRGAFAVRPGKVRAVFSPPIPTRGSVRGAELKAKVAATFKAAAHASEGSRTAAGDEAIRPD